MTRQSYFTIHCVALFVFAFLFCGCDFLGGEKRRQEAEERAQRELDRQELESQRKAMTTYAEGKRRLFQARLSEVAQTEKALRADLKTLTSEMESAMSATDADGAELKYETRLLRLLKSADVNTLAEEHLAGGFSGMVSTYVERVREARAAEANYAAAVRDADRIYGASIEETKKWANMSKQQRETEISRLKKELSSLESQRKRLLKDYKDVSGHAMVGSVHQERARDANKRSIVSKIDDVERQLDVKRRQIDNLTNPDMQNRLAKNAVDAAQTRQRYAISTRKSAMDDIDKRLKPKKSLTDIVAEFEADTVVKLRKVLSDKIAAVEAETKSLKDKITVVDEILLAIPLSDLAELKRHKSKLEK